MTGLVLFQGGFRTEQSSLGFFEPFESAGQGNSEFFAFSDEAGVALFLFVGLLIQSQLGRRKARSQHVKARPRIIFVLGGRRKDIWGIGPVKSRLKHLKGQGPPRPFKPQSRIKNPFSRGDAAPFGQWARKDSQSPCIGITNKNGLLGNRPQMAPGALRKKGMIQNRYRTLDVKDNPGVVAFRPGKAKSRQRRNSRFMERIDHDPNFPWEYPGDELRERNSSLFGAA